MAGKNTDWIAVEGAYRAGIDSLRTIGQKYGVSEAMIRKKARQQGWARDPASTKRAIVNTHMAVGAQGGTQEGAQCALETIRTAAHDDIADMERGLRVHRLCLAALEKAAEGTTEPKEIKIITEAASLAVAGIRKIRGLDTPTPADAKDIDAAIEAELAQLERSRQAGVAAEAEGAE
ncbi:hypothetical protein [Paraburkholderia caballeronis]|uniref:hypothetical protein n=1 Tax=Paraburkholderia caballeronis TaxID=416943 RepID=UPI0010660304|nr:hypothetical protein [Paraburkholderia caballeronis]TDV04676.1 hypothetical protein C7408_13138 [Paraburkholderia caballeronis]TDV07919.1 hypothetical protein C7406_13338 [Paraburkholderia caballeronis]TDV18210.1 hypothetical protein C7404_13138 [Paraburkholderia caballeronis]